MKRKLLKIKSDISELFVSDVFSFSTQKELNKMLVNICKAFILGTIGVALTSYFMGWSITFIVALLTVVGMIVVLLVAVSGYTRVATISFLLVMLTSTSSGMYLAGGMYDVSIVLFPLVIVFGSLILKLPFFILLVAVIVDYFVVVGLRQISGGEEFVHPIIDMGGDLVLVIVIIITEALIMRMLAGIISGALLKAYKSEHDYKEIFNATQSAIFIHDAENGVVLDVNNVTIEMLGYSRDEIIGMSVMNITCSNPEYSNETAMKYVTKAINEGPQLFEWLVRRKDGSEFWAEVMLKLTEIGGTGRVLAIVRNIDERKKLEERLRQGEKMEAVGLLAGGIAHDFNNQLTGIVGYTELSLSGLNDDQQELRDNLNGIMLAADRSAELITQLLAFARKAKYKSVPVDIHGLVKEVASMLNRSIDKKIEIECDFKADTAMIIGDSAQLQNAILNLAINARDAMPEGGVIIFSTKIVTITELDTDFILGDINLGKYLRLTVTDTGTGMSKDVKDRIFEPFFTTKKTGKGTGMGLPAVYGTIKNHGGNISVYSEKGRGASFVISLPLSEQKLEMPSRSIDGLVDSLSGKKILVVDDEDVVCKMVERMIEKCGGTSVICQNGLEAIEYYRQYYNIIDAVVLDMIMPHKDGAETFYELRRINPEVSVIITSGFSINDNVQGLLDTGAKGFIQKPFRIKELCTEVAAACK